MNVFVTGGSGYLGLNLVNTLVERGHSVSVLIRDTSPTEWLPDDVETYRGDVTDQVDIYQSLDGSGCRSVVHLAAVHGRYSSAEMEGPLNADIVDKVNVQGTRNVIEAANRCDVESVVFSSTLKAHPEIEEENQPPYVRSKIDAQGAFSDGNHSFEYSIVNPTVVVGPRDYRLARYQIYQIVSANKILAPPLYKPIEINFVHMQDVVNSIIYYLRNPNSDANVISGKNIRMRRYCKEIAKVSDSSTWIVPMPYAGVYIPKLVDLGHRAELFPIGSDVFSWDDRSVPDRFTSRAPIDLRPIETIVRDTYDWYVEHGLL